LSSAGAALPPTRVPTHSPIAANGSTPAMFTSASPAHCAGARRTPPAVAASVASSSEIAAANSTAIAIFASSIDPGGVGRVRRRRR
jgi:hypothetical protein